jgi:hypothetical protein
VTDYTIVRDWHERPFVTTDGGPLQFVKGRKTPINAEPYTRISTLAGMLDDKSGLIDWAAARAIIGLVKQDLDARRRDCDGAIYAQVAHLISAHSDPWKVPEGKKPLKELVRKAKELGGSEDASGAGTAAHGIWECIDKGFTPDYIPRGLTAWTAARTEALADFEPVLVEPFVVNDELKAAGSPDRYLLHKPTGIVYAADDKTGTDEPSYPRKVKIQVAIASRAVLYDQATGERTPIECDQKRGILIHTPIQTSAPRCHLYWLDLSEGWEDAQLAAQNRDRRNVSKLERVA